MATHLVLDDDLIAEAQSISPHKSQKAMVTEALKEYIQRRKQADIIHLFGQIEYDDNYDYKKQRQIK